MNRMLALIILTVGAVALILLFVAMYREWRTPDRSRRGFLRKLGRRFAVIGLGIMLSSCTLYLVLAAEAPDRMVWDGVLLGGELVRGRVVAIREPFLSCFGKPCVPVKAIRVVAPDGSELFDDLWLEHGQQVAQGELVEVRRLGDLTALSGIEPFQLSTRIIPTLLLFIGLGGLFVVIGGSMLLGERLSRHGEGAAGSGNRLV